MEIIFQSIIWSMVGVIVNRQKILDFDLSIPLAKYLYWVGVPLQIFFLVLNSDFEHIAWIPAIVSVLAMLLGLGFALIVIGSYKQIFVTNTHTTISTSEDFKNVLNTIKSRSSLTIYKSKQTIIPTINAGKGSFILCSILGNTSFIGLALVPSLVSSSYWSWIVLYGVAHTIIGSYGIGAIIAEHFSPGSIHHDWLDRLQNLVLLPSLWGFACGYFFSNLILPQAIEFIISKIILLVVPGAFILIGMRLSRLRQWRNLRLGILPALFKVVILPLATGLLLTLGGLDGDGRLSLVLMSSMPCAFATIILSEAYELDHNIATSSVLLSTLATPFSLYLWLKLF